MTPKSILLTTWLWQHYWLVSETCDPKSRSKWGGTRSWFFTRLTPSRKFWNHSPLLLNRAFCWQPRVGFLCPLHGCVGHGREQIHSSPPGVHGETEVTGGQSALSTQLPETQGFGKCSGNRSCSQPCQTCPPRECIWAPATKCPRQSVHVLASTYGHKICTGRQARDFYPQWTSLGWTSEGLWSR